jgi:hypothetical protein
MLLSHLAARLYGTPLLIARPKLDVMLTRTEKYPDFEVSAR